jgi:hypothetical protein
MKNLLIALSPAVLWAALSASPAPAQRGGHASAPAGRGGAAISRGHSARPGAARRGRGRGLYQGSAYSPYYPGYGYAPDIGYASDLGDDYGLGFQPAEPTPEAPPPQFAYGQPYQPAAPPPKPSVGPVMLELQGDHWVRTVSNGPPQIVGQAVQPEPKQASNQPAALPPAVLVFRDGHQQEIGKYCIIGATIHISTDYWTTGSWTKTVHVRDLDVPATLKLNQERGTNFHLPSSPYEVMVGG